MKSRKDFFLDNSTKNSIARVLSDLINADGFVTANEMERLEKFREDYHLTDDNFIEAKKYTLADAINNIINANWKATNKSVRDFSDELEALITVDGTVAPNEAMICIAFRYAFDFKGAHIFHYSHPRLRFSKREVVYLEGGEDDHTKKINEEINNFYTNISSIFALCGFRFIHIPHLVDDLISLNDDIRIKIIKHFFPEIKDEKLIDELNSKITGISTERFADFIMGKSGIQKFPPSLLFKVASSSVIEDKKRKKYDNFLQVPILKDYPIQTTIQNFTRKFYDMVRDNCRSISLFNGIDFNLHGFHKTILDLANLGEQTVEATLKVKSDTSDKSEFYIGKIMPNFSDRDLSFYLLILYLAITNSEPLGKEHVIKKDAVYASHKKLFHSISAGVRNANIIEEGEEFVTEKNWSNVKSKIVRAIDNQESLDNCEDFLIVLTNGTYTIKTSLNVTVNTKINKKEENISLVQWVEELLRKYYPEH